MASSSMAGADRGRLEQIIAEFLVKSSHMIVQARSANGNQLQSRSKSNRWVRNFVTLAYYLMTS
eukprot:1055551-Pyramimonas_sp.AAC.3